MAQRETVKNEAKMYNHSDDTLEENPENPEMSGHGIGHNSQIHPSTAAQLRSIVERVERLTEEKANIGADIRDVFAEAKGNGFCVKTIKKIIKLRSMDESDRQEEAYMLETYKTALGMTPLEAYAAQQEEVVKESYTPESSEAPDLYEKAVDAVLSGQKATTSFVQRSLGIGYNRAAELIERMEKEGVVSPANEIGKREILLIRSDRVVEPVVTTAKTYRIAAEIASILEHIGDGEYKPETDADKQLVEKLKEMGFMKRGRRFGLYILTEEGKAAIGLAAA